VIDLSSWCVRTRQAVGFGAVCALLVLSVVMGLIAMGRMQADMVSIAHDHWPKIATAANLTTQTDTIAIALRNMMLNPDAADRERQQQVIAKARKDTEDNLQTLDRLLTTAPDREMLRKVQELRSRYFAGMEELRPLILADQNNEAREYLAARLHPVLGEYKTAIGALVESEKNAINDNAKDAAVTYAGTRNLLLGLGVVALLLSACLGWLITRSLVRELGGEPQVAAKMARAVAEGDFTQAITVRPGDQTSLMAQLAAMKESLARGGAGAPQLRERGHGQLRNRTRQPGLVGTHRKPGQRAGRNRRLHGANGRHRAPERRHRAPGQPVGTHRLRRGRARW
jgi:methyl-accepting chemotaxis protein